MKLSDCTIRYSEELLSEMRRKGKKNLSIEVAATNHSDLEVTELYVRYVKDDFADYLVEKKNYSRVTTEVGQVLLPQYRLFLDDTITFYIKKTWIFRSLAVDGVRL